VTVLIGWLWWWVLPIRKQVALDNFTAAFPDEDPTQLRRTVGELVMGYVDLALRRPVKLENMQLVQQGGICLAGHGGAWDLALCAAAQAVPTTIFVKLPSNPLAAWWITRMRERSNIELLSPTGSAFAAIRALKRGRLLVFVMDQRFNDGIRVPFFGRPARTSRGFALLLHRTRAPTFGAWQWRGTDGKHRLRIEALHPEIPDDLDTAVTALTTFSQTWTETQIRTAPHSWLWLHKRWS
jgi:KDO2-lipid IV(A) lauroyltransferase